MSRPIDYSLKKGDVCEVDNWTLGTVIVVDVNWALKTVAVKLGHDGATVVCPVESLFKVDPLVYPVKDGTAIANGSYKEEPKTCLTDGSAPSPGWDEIKDNGQQVDYLVLCPEERAKGYVRPLRRSYLHVGTKLRGTLEMLEKPYHSEDTGKIYVAVDRFQVGETRAGTYLTQQDVDRIKLKGSYGGCDVKTDMSLSLCETYARDPKFYGSTFCCGCGKHLPVGEFMWVEDGQVVGS